MELCFCGHHRSCHKNGSGPCVHCRKVFTEKKPTAQLDDCTSYRPAPKDGLKD